MSSDSSLRLLETGLSIIPLAGKKPCVPWKAFQSRRPNEDEIEKWIQEFPGCNWGVVTGSISGVIILDVDGEAGARSLKECGDLPITWETITGRGTHKWFRHPGGDISSATGVRSGLDVRADGGYVVVPPSIHESGKPYSWKHAPWDTPLADVPSSVLELLRTPPTPKLQITTHPKNDSRIITEGSRNDTLYRIGRHMHAKGLGHDAIEAALGIHNHDVCDPPLAQAEIESIANSSAHQPDRPDFRITHLVRSASMSTVTNPWRCSLALLEEPITETAWLLHELLPTESVILMSGREGTMKTWNALDWANSIAQGQPWLNRESQVGSVLYLDAENPQKVFRARLRAIGGSKNLNIWRWQDSDFPSALNDPRLLEAAQQHDLIIVDSLRRFMEELEENSATDMAKITDHLRQLTRWGASVLVLHHATKDASKPGYRGSTELGAGVDVVMNVRHQRQGQSETVTMTCTKTRYHEEPNLTLQVTRTPERPVFHETGGTTSSSIPGSPDELSSLLAVIQTLQGQRGLQPNQGQIIQEAAQQGLGSRNTILARLRQGTGTLWESNTNGRSRVYQPVQLANSQGTEQLDNSATEQRVTDDLSNPLTRELDTLDTSKTNHLSTCPNGRGVDTLDRFQTASSDDLSNLSNPIGLDRLDNRTRPAGTPEVGSTTNFFDRQGIAQSGTVDLIIEWPGLPESYAYQIDGQIVAPSRVG